MAENKEQSKTEAPKKSLPLGLILQLGFVVVNLGVTGLGAFWVYSGTMGWNNPSITEAQLQAERQALEEKHDEQGAEAGPLVYTMDKFTVNLGGEPKRTIRLEVNLEMLGKDGFEEIINSDNRARARDRIVRLLNDKTFTDLETIQGKLFLKDKIASEVNGILDKGVVKDIYFSEFVVQ
jgi:flagellar FliL protein